MIALADRWARVLASKPETGMGYQIVTVVLEDGTRYDQVIVVAGGITRIRGRGDIPFANDDIADIIVTHDRWDFAAEPLTPP